MRYRYGQPNQTCRIEGHAWPWWQVFPILRCTCTRCGTVRLGL